MRNLYKTIVPCIALSMLLTACGAESSNIETNDTAQSVEDTTAHSITVENPDFRKVKWGMSKDDVVSIEGEPISEFELEENYYRIAYDNIPILDYSAELYYYFKDNILVESEYRFNWGDKTDLQIHNMYITLRKEYVSKYGEPADYGRLISNLDYPPSSLENFISDTDFNFGEVVGYNDKWSNINGMNIDMEFGGVDSNGERFMTLYISYKPIDSNI